MQDGSFLPNDRLHKTSYTHDMGIRLGYIQPGNPQQNAYVERFNRTVRYEWLAQYYWSSIKEVQDHATQWTWSYNHDRPHMWPWAVSPQISGCSRLHNPLLLTSVKKGGITIKKSGDLS